MFSLCILSTGKENFSFYRNTRQLVECCWSVLNQAAVQWQRDERGYMPMQQYFGRQLKWLEKLNFEHQFWLFLFLKKITIIQNQLTSSYVGKCFKFVMQHIERGTLQKLCVSHFITMIMVNVSHVLCCFIDCFVEQVFQKTWGLLSEGRHQTNSTFTIIMVMKWDTSSFCKVPPLLMCCIAIVLWLHNIDGILYLTKHSGTI